MRMESVPAPLMSAPMELRKLARSTMCGSLAAFSMVVVPSARLAAIIRFSVAPTLGTRRKMRSPFNRPPPGTSATTSSSRIWIDAPRISRPFRCRSIGRAPMAQPPGKLSTARPKRARSGPIMSTEARIFLIYSTGACTLSTGAPSTSIRLPSNVMSAPSDSNTSLMISTSAKRGTSSSTQRPWDSNVATMIGRTAFFAPLMRTSPLSLRPPVTMILSNSSRTKPTSPPSIALSLL